MAESIGNTRPLSVSPNHRMLVTGWRAEIHFGDREILVPAKALINGDTIRAHPCTSVTYVHLLMDRHEVIFAEGAATETLHPGDYLMAGASSTSAEILELFPELAYSWRCDTQIGNNARKTNSICGKGTLSAACAAWRTARPVCGAGTAPAVDRILPVHQPAHDFLHTVAAKLSW
jgi:hypothetical protein